MHCIFQENKVCVKWKFCDFWFYILPFPAKVPRTGPVGANYLRRMFVFQTIVLPRAPFSFMCCLLKDAPFCSAHVTCTVLMGRLQIVLKKLNGVLVSKSIRSFEIEIRKLVLPLKDALRYFFEML